jgi:hypothetical protein
MSNEPEEKVFAMHVSRLRKETGKDRTSPAESPGRDEHARDRSAGGQAGTAPAESVSSEEVDQNPGGGPENFNPSDADYKAFGWAGNKTQPSLVIIVKDGSEYSINYCDLASACPNGSMFLPAAPGCDGNVIRLLVSGPNGTFMIVAEGELLRPVWGLVMAHKTPWIRELPAGADFVQGDQPVIRSIGFAEPQRATAVKGLAR